MRHKVKTDRLSRFSSYRKATIKSLVRSLLLHEKIITTQAKAKISRIVAENLISLGKENTLAAKRRAFAILCDHGLVSTLFSDIATLFGKRNGGYTRIIPYRNRRGDNAKLVILELTEKKEKKLETTKEQKKTEKKEAEKAADKVKEKIKPREVELKEEKKQDKIKDKEDKQEIKEPIKQEPEVTQPTEETKPHTIPEEEHKHKLPQEKKPKKFLQGFKGFFKRERDSL